MDVSEFDLLLADRLGVIRSMNEKYDLEHNAYLSFSGGKDSTVLHYLLDLALPCNSIPRVYIDTGIEYVFVRRFVSSLAAADPRFHFVRPRLPIRLVLDRFGYPFKSKEHALRVYQFNRGSDADYIKRYVTGLLPDGSLTHYRCPKSLLYQFSERGSYNFSNLCCYKLKKEPARLWEKENGRFIALTGLRRDEGGNRSHAPCVVFKGLRLVHFHPLLVIDDAFEEAFISRFGLSLCELYYPPYSMKRTGCKGCPFNPDLQSDLTMMACYLPAERAQCEIIWDYVYSEYRRVGYRLDKKEQLRLF